MKILSVFKYMFSAVGIVLLVGGFLAYKDTSDFLLDAISAQGTVTGLEQSRSSDSVSYYPIVSFIGINGQPVKFRSSVGSSRSSYAEGEKVEVLYSSSDPAGAKLKSFFCALGCHLGNGHNGRGFSVYRWAYLFDKRIERSQKGVFAAQRCCYRGENSIGGG